MKPLYFQIDPAALGLYMDKNVRELCKECKRYGEKDSCPPYLPEIDVYIDRFKQYKNGTLIIKKFIIDDIKNWKELGKNSSEELRRDILDLVDELKYEQYNNIDYYGAGSCKNCIKCSHPCRFPNKQLIPIEGTGINVVKLVEDTANITIKFPVENYGYFYRVGLVLYD